MNPVDLLHKLVDDIIAGYKAKTTNIWQRAALAALDAVIDEIIPDAAQHVNVTGVRGMTAGSTP